MHERQRRTTEAPHGDRRPLGCHRKPLPGASRSVAVDGNAKAVGSPGALGSWRGSAGGGAPQLGELEGGLSRIAEGLAGVFDHTTITSGWRLGAAYALRRAPSELAVSRGTLQPAICSFGSRRAGQVARGRHRPGPAAGGAGAGHARPVRRRGGAGLPADGCGSGQARLMVYPPARSRMMGRHQGDGFVYQTG